MATTANEVQQAIQALKNFEDQIEAAILNVNNGADRIFGDPSQPGAIQLYEQLAEERQATVSEPWNSTAQGLITTLDNNFRNSPLDVQQALQIEYDLVKNRAGRIVTSGKFQKEDTLPKVLAAIQKANQNNQTSDSNLADDEELDPENLATDGTGNTLGAGEGNSDEGEGNLLNGSADDDTVQNTGTTIAGSGLFGDNPMGQETFDPSNQYSFEQFAKLGTGNSDPGTLKTTTANPAPKPGIRTYNPLGSFASYTYQITLYTVTPEAYEAYVLSDRQNIFAKPDGVFLIAQSGGINNQTTQRAAGFNLDYYIDDLRILSKITGKETATSTNMTDVSFTIYEPYGFSFLSNLRRANLGLIAKSSIPNMTYADNPMKQFYILGIRFQGYDINGELITSADFNDASPDNPFRGLKERYVDVSFKELKFRLDGKLSTYRITAAATCPTEGFGLKRGRIDHRLTVTSDTVFDAFTGNEGLFTKINKQQQELAATTGPNGSPVMRVPNQYKVEFRGGPRAEAISKASLVNQADLDKFRMPMSEIKNSSESTDSASLDARPKPAQRTFSFDNSTPIVQAIDDIIKNSDYMTSALKVLYSEALEPSDDPDDPDELNQTKNVTIAWYKVSAQLKPLAWDDILNDWAYEVTYVIEPYIAPNIVTPYAGKIPKYYGPHKVYDYWYTGKNTEVISFEQQLDNAFTMVVLESDGVTPSVKASGASMKVGLRENQSRTGSRDVGLEAQNSVLTSLFSPADWAEAKITIMGDPDFLMKESTTTSEVYNQFYGADNFTINPNGGQVFIEINFKEGIDYDNTKGTMTLNDSIVFWQDRSNWPASLKAKIKGIVYNVTEVQSSFSKGKFTQELTLRLHNFPEELNNPTNTGAGTVLGNGDSDGVGGNGVGAANFTDVTPGVVNAGIRKTGVSSGTSTTSSTGTTNKGDNLIDQGLTVGVSAEAYDALSSYTDLDTEFNTGVTVVSAETVPSANYNTVTDVAGSQLDSQVQGLETLQTGPITTVVADDDGTIDTINQQIILSASDANNPDAGRPANVNIGGSSANITSTTSTTITDFIPPGP
jgi:hypothetical protein